MQSKALSGMQLGVEIPENEVSKFLKTKSL